MKSISFMGFTPAQKDKYFRSKDSAEEQQLIEETVEKFDKFVNHSKTQKMLDGDTLELSRITPKGYKGVSWALKLTEKTGKELAPFELAGSPIDKKTIYYLINDTMLYVGVAKLKLSAKSSRSIIKNMFENFYK